MTAMRLLGMLELHDGKDLIDVGQVRPVREWATEWTAGVEVGDRGPKTGPKRMDRSLLGQSSEQDRTVGLQPRGRPGPSVGGSVYWISESSPQDALSPGYRPK
jgi:hypothetical protein